MNTCKQGICWLFCLLSFSQISAQDVTQYNLKQAIDHALENSSQVRNALITIEDAEAQIAELRSTGLPQVNGSLGYTRYFEVPVQVLPDAFVEAFSQPGEPPIDREVSFLLRNNLVGEVNLQTLLFDGTYLVGLRAAKSARAYAQKQLRQVEYEVTNSVVDAYVPILLLDENLDLLDSNIMNLNRLLFETKETYQAGFAEQLDVDRLELSLANLETERSNLGRQRESALRALKFTINYPLEQELLIEDDIETLVSSTDPALLTTDVDLSRRPELAVIEQGLVLSDLNIKRYKAGYLPSLRGNAAYQYQYQGNTFSDGFWAPTGFVGLSLNVPIFDGLQKKAQIQRARLEKENILIQQQDVIRLIKFEVSNARIQYQNAGERLTSQQKNLDLARRIYETTQIKYREGVGSSLEVTQAEQSLYESQSNYLQALYDRLVAKNKLEQALGL